MDINITTPTATQVDALKRDGSNANSDVDLGAYALNANSFKINGTAGAGHIDLKHQSSDATSPASSTALWADSNGDIKWKIDGNYKTILKTSGNNADRTYTFQNANGTLAFISDIPSLAPYLTIAAAAAAYEPIITKNTAFNRNFGTSSGDILLQTGTVASKMLITDSSNKVTTATFSSGDVVLLDQPQTLTNKTISGYLTTSAAASTYEPIISSKGTAFNKNFGTSSGDILLQTGTTANKILITDSNNKVTTATYSSGDIVLNTHTILQDESILAYMALGSAIFAQTVGVNMRQIATGLNMASQTIYVVPVYLKTAQNVTGVKWYQNTKGNYTASNENRIGLYTYSGGTLTLVASTANDGTLWQTANNTTYGNKAFSNSYSASAGLYFVALLYSSSAQVTAPQIGMGSATVGSSVIGDFTNSAKLFSAQTSITALPSSQAMSGLTVTTSTPWVGLY